jgi:hypothetical protein
VMCAVRLVAPAADSNPKKSARTRAGLTLQPYPFGEEPTACRPCQPCGFAILR